TLQTPGCASNRVFSLSRLSRITNLRHLNCYEIHIHIPPRNHNKPIIIPMKLRTHRRRNAGFTLVEIMLVVATIALLASIAMPSVFRARKRSQATRILEDLRMVDSAMQLYAMEFNCSGS